MQVKPMLAVHDRMKALGPKRIDDPSLPMAALFNLEDETSRCNYTTKKWKTNAFNVNGAPCLAGLPVCQFSVAHPLN
jgi:hypothetical protein